MGQFNAMKLTNKGLALFNKVQLGTQLQLTKVAIGDGSLSAGQTLEGLTSLVNKTQDLSIISTTNNTDGTVSVQTSLSNQGLSTGKYIREIGLYATDPIEGEILYSVTNSGTLADYLPAEGSNIVENIINIVAKTGNASNVSAVIDKSLVHPTVQDFNNYQASINSTLAEKAKQMTAVYNVKGYGAKGDGITDDSNAIQSCLDAIKLAGGGVCYFPDGKYITSKYFEVPNNTIIKGNGETSWIHNNVVSGIQRIVFMLENAGDARDATGPLAETYYPIVSMESNKVDVGTNISNFSVGDLVYIVSDSLVPSGDGYVRLYEMIDKIVKISGNIITLKYGYNVNILSAKIAKVGATAIGWDNKPIWLTENSKIEDLKLSHGQGMSSGMYVIFSGGFECEYRRLKIIGSTLMGSNSAGHCIYEDIDGEYDAGCFDNASFQCDNIFRRIKAIRTGNNTAVNNLGFVVNNGKDNIIENCDLDFDGIGGISAIYTQNPIIRNNIIRNPKATNSNNAIMGANSWKSTIEGNTIINVDITQNGIYGASGSIIQNNKIYGFSKNVGKIPISVAGNVYVKNNEVDGWLDTTYSPYTPIKNLDYEALPSNLYKSGTTYYSFTSQTSVISGTVYKKTSRTTNRHIKMIIHGTFRTKLNTANLQVQVGGTAIFNNTQAVNASDQNFLLEMDLIMPGQGNMRYINKFTITTPVITTGSFTINASGADITFNVLASIVDTTAADFVSIDGYSIEYFE